ncbi:hypothetical protein EIP91_004835 [Steccherinum ochraceum]|uniref:Transcription factor CBF/NF-Y/archaeal histone domain-containing protein n=1 Tax=Steccherinum ochraceum TaxID=92696 RepID=A0A4R0RQQ6_9APHY|nr:hypothetical protein EIP91_004835 [Steccherinum ochraceum]
MADSQQFTSTWPQSYARAEDDFEQELFLRSHIRGHLLNYALKHLTTDYIAFTEDAAAELLADSLSPVATSEPTDLIMQPALPEAIRSGLRLKDFDSYEERWTISPEETSYLRKTLDVPRGVLATTRCWRDEDHDELFWRAQRPMSPILTLRSLRETPKPGFRTSTVFPKSLDAIMNDFEINVLSEPEVKTATRIALDDALNMRLQLDPDDVDAMKDLLKTIPSLSRKQDQEQNPHVAAFLRTDSPVFQVPRLQSPPLFSRDRNPGYDAGSPKAGMKSMRDIVTFLPRQPLDVDNPAASDLYEEHMAVIDGWTTYVPTSSPTPSLASSSSEIDELLPSPPNQSPLLFKLLEDASMDEHFMCKADRSRSAVAKSQIAGDDQSLSTFLSPILRPIPRRANPRVILSPKSQPSSPRTAITVSMLGQPPSDPIDPTETLLGPPSDAAESDDVQDLVSKLLGRHHSEVPKDPLAYVLSEKLEDQEALMMDVPQLLPPNEHPSIGSQPSSMGDLMIDLTDGVEGVSTEDKTFESWRCLRKVKGLQALNIELSWRPFNYGYHVPTHEEVAGVDESTPESFRTALSSDIQDSDVAVANLLDDLHLDSGTCNLPSMQWCEESEDASSMWGHTWESAEDDFVLTEQERRRVHGYPQRACTSEDPSSPRSSDGPQLDGSEEVKRRRPNTPDDVDIDMEPPHSLPSEDSGIHLSGIFDGSVSFQYNQFSRISEEAEGFPGPSQDGELFPDIDPIHFEHGHSLRTSLTLRKKSSNLPSKPTHTHSEATFIPLSFEPTQQCPRPGECTEAPSYVHAQDLLEDPQAYGTRESTPDGSGLGEAFASSLQSPQQKAPEPPLVPYDLISLECGPICVPSDLELPGVSENEQAVIRETVPPALVDRNTLDLPEYPPERRHQHRYIASMYILERRCLVRSLALPQNAVDLVEREELGGAHLLLDPDSAVYCTSLVALSSQSDELLAAINRLSWNVLNILVVFEAFPASSYYKPDQRVPSVKSFSPPVIKSVHKLRRDISLAEACFNKCPEANIQYAFALSVDEVAEYIRVFGDAAEGRDVTGGVVWGARDWLASDEQEGERDLAKFVGMNAFVASIILSQDTLDEFLQKTPEERLAEHGDVVGSARMMHLSLHLRRRRRARLHQPPAVRETGKASFPISRVQKILKADDELPMIAREATFLISVATEEFIKRLAEESSIVATRENRVTVQYRDLAAVVRRVEKFMFLDEIIPLQNPSAPAKRKAKQKEDSQPDRPTTMLDAFVGRAQSPERPDEDVVMNEDGTMTLES